MSVFKLSRQKALLLSLLLCLVWDLDSSSNVYAAELVNLLRNSDFRLLDSDHLPLYWNTRVRAGERGTPDCQFSLTEYGIDDNAAFSLAVTEANRTQAIAEIYQTVAVTPGRRYYFSVFVCVRQTGSMVRRVVLLLDSQRKSLGHVSARVDSINPPGQSGGYQLFECDFVAKDDQHYVTVSLGLQNLGVGVVCFDKAVLVELSGQK